jgi:vancomycin permeability regulator SanA
MRKVVTKVIGLILILAAAAIGVSAYVAATAGRDIVLTHDGTEIDADTIESLKSVDPQCILVLGCSVWADNQPSPMLQDRLDTAINLYKKGAAPKLLLSGDNSVPEYSEPDSMYRYALSRGVPDEDIFLDFAGFSTYDSVYRAREVFCADRMIIVTQKYHLFRALKIADALGVEAMGAASDQRQYQGRYYREFREVLARNKDFVKCIFKPEPVFLGEKIPVDGDGRVTHLN